MSNRTADALAVANEEKGGGICCRSAKPELLRFLLATLDGGAATDAATEKSAASKPVANGHTNGFVNGWIRKAASPLLSKQQQARAASCFLCLKLPVREAKSVAADSRVFQTFWRPRK